MFWLTDSATIKRPEGKTRERVCEREREGERVCVNDNTHSISNEIEIMQERVKS